MTRYSSNQRACAEEGTRENKKSGLGDCPQGKQYLRQVSLSPGFHPENSKCSGDHSVHMPGQTTWDQDSFRGTLSLYPRHAMLYKLLYLYNIVPEFLPKLLSLDPWRVSEPTERLFLQLHQPLQFNLIMEPTQQEMKNHNRQ